MKKNNLYDKLMNAATKAPSARKIVTMIAIALICQAILFGIIGWIVITIIVSIK